MKKHLIIISVFLAGMWVGFAIRSNMPVMYVEIIKEVPRHYSPAEIEIIMDCDTME